ncbi:MAG: hypothetical protein NUW37_07175 [Planctomycetes bacterium]|nr:hypothetical protein [Planctomycetota bacterium]
MEDRAPEIDPARFERELSLARREALEYLDRLSASNRDRDRLRGENETLRLSVEDAKRVCSELQDKYYESFRELETLRRDNVICMELYLHDDQSTARDLPPLTCNVTAVDETFGLALLSAGRADGVTMGMKFLLDPGGTNYVATVTRVYNDNCAVNLRGCAGPVVTGAIAELTDRSDGDRPRVRWPSVRCTVVSIEGSRLFLDAGEDKRVIEGMEFAVYSGEQFKAIVTVDEVLPDRCSAAIDDAKRVREILVGDSARTAN